MPTEIIFKNPPLVSKARTNVELLTVCQQDTKRHAPVFRYHYINAKKLNVLPEDDEGGGDEFERYLSQYRDHEDPYYSPGYSRLRLNGNRHFSGIPVNTNRSAVHVPTNVFDGGETRRSTLRADLGTFGIC